MSTNNTESDIMIQNIKKLFNDSKMDEKMTRTDVKKPYIIDPLNLIKKKEWYFFIHFDVDPVNINQTYSNNWTLLHFAAENEASIDVFESLIKQGFDLYAQDDQGRTPFDIAVEKCNLYTAQNIAKLYKE